MTFADILHVLPTLTCEQRAELLWRLDVQQRFDDPAHVQELSRRLEEARGGQFVTADQLRAMLESRGKQAA